MCAGTLPTPCTAVGQVRWPTSSLSATTSVKIHQSECPHTATAARHSASATATAPAATCPSLTCGSVPPAASKAFASGSPTSAGRLLTSFDRVAGVQLLLPGSAAAGSAAAAEMSSSPNSSCDQESRLSSASVAVLRSRCRCTRLRVASSSCGRSTGSAVQAGGTGRQ
jgi:hypothetical protein